MAFKTSRPLLLPPDMAKEFGLNEAIILHQLDYWIEHNRANEQNCHEGRYWTFNSVRAWQEQFPWWSIDTIRRVLNKLEKDNLILSSSFNKTRYDRTKWYSIRYENPRFTPFMQNAQMDSCGMHQPIPETTKRSLDGERPRKKRGRKQKQVLPVGPHMVAEINAMRERGEPLYASWVDEAPSGHQVGTKQANV
jgi:hypothetical protein